MDVDVPYVAHMTPINVRSERNKISIMITVT